MQLRSGTLTRVYQAPEVRSKAPETVLDVEVASISTQTDVESYDANCIVDSITDPVSAFPTSTSTINMHDPRRVLIFDTETTGLVPKTDHQKRLYPALEEYPYMLQLCFVIYNLDTESIEQEYTEYIRVDDDVPILPIITQITGITRDMCTSRGVDVSDAMTAFYDAYRRCGVVVAHNIRFDKEVIKAEMERNHHAMVDRGCACPVALFHHVYMRIHGMSSVCTMLDGARIAKQLPPSGAISDPASDPSVPIRILPYKWPKLAELHRRLFGTVPEGLHDARVDVMACLRCFLELRRRDAMV